MTNTAHTMGYNAKSRKSRSEEELVTQVMGKFVRLE
jgi:hypothetical protein